MRFIVFIDLLGTIILPATAVYMVYLIVTVATGNGPIPIIAIVMIAAVYGLQAIIFLLKRQWQYIGWMVIYVRFVADTDDRVPPVRLPPSDLLFLAYGRLLVGQHTYRCRRERQQKGRGRHGRRTV